MSEQRVINARGLSCPQPVLLTKKALDSMKSGEIKVFVDTVTSRENVMRYAKNSGWGATFETQEEVFCLLLTKDGE